MTAFRLRKTIVAALFTATAVAFGYSLAQFPNIELISATVFVAGYVLGMKVGILVGAAAMFLYSMFNPYGIAFPPVLLAQVASMAVTGFAGGLFASQRVRRTVWKASLTTGLTGLVLTAVFDFATTVATVLAVLWGGDANQAFLPALAATFSFGAGFYALHLVSNTLIFALLVPPLVRHLPARRPISQTTIKTPTHHVL